MLLPVHFQQCPDEASRTPANRLLPQQQSESPATTRFLTPVGGRLGSKGDAH